MHDATPTPPADGDPGEGATRPLPPSGPELIAAAGLGDVRYLLGLGMTTTEIARRMFIREVALIEALRLDGSSLFHVS